jgi:hypothetical protein
MCNKPNLLLVPHLILVFEWREGIACASRVGKLPVPYLESGSSATSSGNGKLETKIACRLDQLSSLPKIKAELLISMESILVAILI